MTENQVTPYLQALLGALFTQVVMPAVLLVIAGGLVWLLLARAQRNEKFDLSQVLLDERGKTSSERIVMFGAFVVSSWALCVVVLAAPQLFEAAYLIYLGTWGATGAAKAIFRNKYPAPPSAPEGQ